MKKNVILYIGIISVVIAAIFAVFTGVEGAQWLELVGFTTGLALCVVGMVQKAEKKDWKLYVSIVSMILGTTLLIFSGISGKTVESIILAVIGAVSLIVGILPICVKSRKKE